MLRHFAPRSTALATVLLASCGGGAASPTTVTPPPDQRQVATEVYLAAPVVTASGTAPNLTYTTSYVKPAATQRIVQTIPRFPCSLSVIGWFAPRVVVQSTGVPVQPPIAWWDLVSSDTTILSFQNPNSDKLRVTFKKPGQYVVTFRWRDGLSATQQFSTVQDAAPDAVSLNACQ